VLVGSAVAVLLLAATTALIFRGGGINPGRETNPQLPPASRSDPAVAARAPAGESRVAEPPAPKPPSFDIVKVGPTRTAVIGGPAGAGRQGLVRGCDKGERRGPRRSRGGVGPHPGSADRCRCPAAVPRGVPTRRCDTQIRRDGRAVDPPARTGKPGRDGARRY